MKSPGQYFRAGVGAAIVNPDGLVLALERSDIPGAWQLPQGGLKANETPVEALYREIKEETGISKARLELLDTYPELLAYELPIEAWSAKTGRGQVDYWFLLRHRGADSKINLEDAGEFRSWKWMSIDHLLAAVVDFRKPVYRHLSSRFRTHFSRPHSE
jgi:putative (di)nucleoside polyphosphate hydrolase